MLLIVKDEIMEEEILILLARLAPPIKMTITITKMMKWIRKNANLQ